MKQGISLATTWPNRGRRQRAGAASATRFPDQFHVVDTVERPRLLIRHMPALDGLRAIAVLAVMVVHARMAWGGGGWMGVDLFFVLSGFLITSILLAEWDTDHRIDFRRFYVKRILRLVPALVVFVVATTIAGLVLGTEMTAQELLRAATYSLIYVSNWAAALNWVAMGPFEHTWSLAIEEQFYLLWPPVLLMLLAAKCSASVRAGIVIALITLSALLRTMIFASEGADNPWRTYAGFDTRADSVLMGCLLALVIATGAIRISPRVARALGYLAFGIVISLILTLSVDDAYGPQFNYGGYSLLALVMACLIGAVVLEPSGPLVAFLSLPAITWIGRISYALYLWHLPLFRRISDDPTPIKIGLCFIASFALATASYYLVEQPFLRLKNRLGRPAIPPAP